MIFLVLCNLVCTSVATRCIHTEVNWKDGENEEAREDSLVIMLLNKYLYKTFKLFSGTFMSMKVAITHVYFYRSCSASIFGRKEMKLPFFPPCYFSWEWKAVRQALITSSGPFKRAHGPMTISFKAIVMLVG